MFEYRAKVLSVHDGDTIRVNVDLGCDISVNLTLRLMGINAPELRTPEGPVARDWLIAALGSGDLVIRTVKDKREKYGRYLAWLWQASEGAFGALGVDTFGANAFITTLPSINQRMVAAGQAVVYLP